MTWVSCFHVSALVVGHAYRNSKFFVHIWFLPGKNMMSFSTLQIPSTYLLFVSFGMIFLRPKTEKRNDEKLASTGDGLLAGTTIEFYLGKCKYYANWMVCAFNGKMSNELTLVGFRADRVQKLNPICYIFVLRRRIKQYIGFDWI